MMENGIGTRALTRRCQRYRKYFNDPVLQDKAIVLKYKEQINAATATPAGLAANVRGDNISGEALRTFSDTPTLCGPLVCQLCDADFLYDEDFATHKKQVHAGDNEYRKRVLYLLQQRGCRPIAAQEKRLTDLCGSSAVSPPRLRRQHLFALPGGTSL